ncbi:MAG: TrmH family RNA methyltransferase [Cyclobacteriaceae bacterium]
MRKLKNEELDRLSPEAFRQSQKLPIRVLLDNVRSLNNVGSAFRTSDAFRVDQIILTGITGQPPHREIQKTALGATDNVDWCYEKTTAEAIAKLKADTWTIVSIEQVDQSVSLDIFMPDADQKYCFIFGNEVFGVEDEAVNASDICIEIPQFGTKHSLNISVSIGIVLWDFAVKSKFRGIS